MSQPTLFDLQLALPDDKLARKARTLVGFPARLARVRSQLRLILEADKLGEWSRKHHKGQLPITSFIDEQYPFVVFHGDVGTGKTATAECLANEIVIEARAEDSILFKLSNRVRGRGKVGEMGSLITDAFEQITKSIGKSRRAILIVDEGDSLGASRAQEHSHHEDKAGVNTLIQCVDDLRRHGGRIVVFLCTNRLSVLDPAIVRRAAIIENFQRPAEDERRQLLVADLEGLDFSPAQFERLVELTGPRGGAPGWTYSDIRARLYPTALSRAYPDRPLTFADVEDVAKKLTPSPVLEDR